MAKVTLGPIITDARGSVGSVVYSRNRTGTYTRNRIKPGYPASAPQLNSQSALTGARNAWILLLTDTQREQWNAFAANNPFPSPVNGPRTISGFNLFERLNYWRSYASWPPLLDPPPDLDIPTNATLTITANTSSPQDLAVNVAFATPPIPGTITVIWATPPISQGRLNFRRWLKIIYWSYSSGAIDLLSSWVTAMTTPPYNYPNLISNSRIGLRLEIVNPNNGTHARVALASSITT